MLIRVLPLSLVVFSSLGFSAFFTPEHAQVTTELAPPVTLFVPPAAEATQYLSWKNIGIGVLVFSLGAVILWFSKRDPSLGAVSRMEAILLSRRGENTNILFKSIARIEVVLDKKLDTGFLDTRQLFPPFSRRAN